MVSQCAVKQLRWLVAFTIMQVLGIGGLMGGIVAPTLANPGTNPAPFTPPKSGVPTDTRSGGSRGESACFPNQHGKSLLLTPLVPPSSQGLTRLSHPSFFVYIPQTTAQEMFFSLKDEQQRIRYQTTIKISGDEGVMRIRLPKTASSLEVGKRYQWGATLLCAGKFGPDSPFVIGWVERAAPAGTMNNRLHTASDAQPVASSHFPGIWYDTIENLADLKQQQPRDSHLASTWQTLLESIGLGSIAVAPLLTEL